jgi:hypothetical protein
LSTSSFLELIQRAYARREGKTIEYMRRQVHSTPQGILLDELYSKANALYAKSNTTEHGAVDRTGMVISKDGFAFAQGLPASIPISNAVSVSAY